MNGIISRHIAKFILAQSHSIGFVITIPTNERANVYCICLLRVSSDVVKEKKKGKKNKKKNKTRDPA
jgi:hypothetical protein